MLTDEVNTFNRCERGSISPSSPRLMEAWSYLVSSQLSC